MTRSRMKSRRQASHLAGGGGEVRASRAPQGHWPFVNNSRAD